MLSCEEQFSTLTISTVLTVTQFKRFVDVIKKLGDRVQKEHDQYLRDSQRTEDRSAVNGRTSLSTNPTGAVDFESLVGNSLASPSKTDVSADASKNWEDDVWGSIFSSGTSVSPTRAYKFTFALILAQASPVQSPALSPPIPSIAPQTQRTISFAAHQQTQSLPSSPKVSSALNPHAARSSLSRPGPGLGATRISSTSYNPSAFASSSPAPAPMAPMQPTLSAFNAAPQALSYNAAPPPAPNYNITLPSAQSVPSMQPLQPTTSASPPPPFFASQMSMGSVLAPSKPAQPQWSGSSGAPKQLSKDEWGDFDPLA